MNIKLFLLDLKRLLWKRKKKTTDEIVRDVVNSVMCSKFKSSKELELRKQKNLGA